MTKATTISGQRLTTVRDNPGESAANSETFIQIHHHHCCQITPTITRATLPRIQFTSEV